MDSLQSRASTGNFANFCRNSPALPYVPRSQGQRLRAYLSQDPLTVALCVQVWPYRTGSRGSKKSEDLEISAINNVFSVHGND